MSAELLVKKISQVYSLPDIYYRLRELIDSPNATAAQIGTLINEDISLSARLLRLVNSAFFGFNKKVETVTQAVTVVGMQQLQDLVLATKVITLFENIPQELLDLKGYWQHSIATGVAARIIATQRGEHNPERLFVAGLLQDIGSLIIFSHLPEQAHRCLQSAHAGSVVMHTIEERLLGFSHNNIGYLLMKSWQLPPTLSEVARYHHKPALAQNYMEEIATCHVADIIVSALQLGNNGNLLIPPLEPLAWQQLKLSESVISRIVKQVDQQYEDAIQFVLG